MSFYQQIAGQRRSNSAFTLFELIGVLAIISIILAMVAPMTLQMLKLQRQQADKAALPEIAQALKLAMLREQSFPSTSSWWDMAARHGAGSANEIRYSDNQQSVERRLYFAGSSSITFTAFPGRSFFSVVSANETNWLPDPNDPTELRLLLLSTINPDLDLPATLSTTEFDAIWTNWSNAPDAPTTPATFGLASAWAGRAGELNIERIDLRDFLCQVAIENAYYASGFYDSSTGELKGSFSASDFGFSAVSDYLQATVQIGTGNLSGAKVALNLSNSSIVKEPVTGPPVGTTYHQATQLHSSEPVLVLNAGRVIDEEKDANIIIRLQSVDENGPGSSTEYTFTVYDEDGSKNRAPIDLIHPSGGTNHPLSFTDRYSKRYFLSGQTLLLGIPWTSPVQPAGTVPITDNQSTLRFDGLSWHY
jgi:type II secretory pathway pseudopilin PulG